MLFQRLAASGTFQTLITNFQIRVLARKQFQLIGKYSYTYKFFPMIEKPGRAHDTRFLLPAPQYELHLSNINYKFSQMCAAPKPNQTSSKSTFLGRAFNTPKNFSRWSKIPPGLTVHDFPPFFQRIATSCTFQTFPLLKLMAMFFHVLFAI